MKNFIFFLFLTFYGCSSYAQTFIVTPDKVIDGDTIKIKEKFLGLNLSIRIDGIDTPEKGTKAKCLEENVLSKQATAFTSNFIKRSKVLKITAPRWDKYGGRLLAKIEADGKDLGEQLILNGLAKEYHGKKKQSWCNK